MPFADRDEAGKLLAQKLRLNYQNSAAQPVVVLGLPRGGVPLAVAVARALHAPLDLVITRKVGHPQQREYAIAAVSEGGALVENEREVARIDPFEFERWVELERSEASRRRQVFTPSRAPMPLDGATALLIDDGVATGLTMRAALRDALRRGAARCVVAVPVASEEAVAALMLDADAVITLEEPRTFLGAVGGHYRSFPQLSDSDVRAALEALYAERERVA